MVSIETCIALQPVASTINSCTEPCMLEIKTKNCQKIARIAVVSEGEVLEIFKQFGEYETTVFAEFIDECEGNTVFFGDTTMQPPTAEVSIKVRGKLVLQYYSSLFFFFFFSDVYIKLYNNMIYSM